MKTIIMLSGKMRSGKNTFGGFLGEYYKRDSNSTVKHIELAFADELKLMCSEVFQPLLSYLNSIADNPAVSTLFPGLKTDKANWWEPKTAVTRLLLQAVGTGIVRNIDDGYWTKAVIKKIEASDAEVVVITDARYPNEIELIKKRGFRVVLVRISRNNCSESSGHISETALDDHPFDFVIDNNGTKEELEQKAIDFLKVNKLLIEDLKK
jgi:hypothetical protein